MNTITKIIFAFLLVTTICVVKAPPKPLRTKVLAGARRHSAGGNMVAQTPRSRTQSHDGGEADSTHSGSSSSRQHEHTESVGDLDGNEDHPALGHTKQLQARREPVQAPPSLQSAPTSVTPETAPQTPPTSRWKRIKAMFGKKTDAPATPTVAQATISQAAVTGGTPPLTTAQKWKRRASTAGKLVAGAGGLAALGMAASNLMQQNTQGSKIDELEDQVAALKATQDPI